MEKTAIMQGKLNAAFMAADSCIAFAKKHEGKNDKKFVDSVALANYFAGMANGIITCMNLTGEADELKRLDNLTLELDALAKKLYNSA